MKYVRQNFLQRRHDPTLEAWNADALGWLEQVANAKPNDTTGVPPDVRFEDERPLLTRVEGIAPYVVAQWEERLVHNGYISVQGKKYSVPSGLALKEVRLRWIGADVFEIWDHERQITSYVLNEEADKTMVYRPEHLPQVKGAPEEGDLGLATAPHVQKAPEVETRSLDYYEQIGEEEFPDATLSRTSTAVH